MRTIPDVQDVGWSSGLPLGDSVFGEYPFTYEIAGDAPLAEAERPITTYQLVSPTYFSALELPLGVQNGLFALDIDHDYGVLAPAPPGLHQ